MIRQVVLIFGPPGAGKTTYARTLGLHVLDRDDPQWRNEAHFTSALKQLGANPTARAAVIRSGASASSRRRTTLLVRATQVVVLDTDLDTCIRRIAARGRPNEAGEIAAARRWWKTYTQSIPAKNLADKYGYRHRLERKKWEPIVAAGNASCAEPVCVMPTRWIEPGSRWHLSHDPTGTRYIGPSHGSCNEAENARRNNPKRAAARHRWVL